MPDTARPVRAALALLDSMVKSGQHHDKKSMAALDAALTALDASGWEPSECLAVVRITLGAGGSENQIEKRVTLCNGEDQAHAELERQAMRSVQPNDTEANIRRGAGWFKVKTHNTDGSPGSTHYFEVEKATRSTA